MRLYVQRDNAIELLRCIVEQREREKKREMLHMFCAVSVSVSVVVYTSLHAKYPMKMQIH